MDLDFTRQFGHYQTVILKGRTEIKPLFFLDSNVLGVIIDKTVPNYYLVKFEDFGAYWVSGDKLVKYTLSDY